MSLKSKFKRTLSGLLSMAIVATIVPYFPVSAEDSEKYPYIMFAASDAEGAITINANNFCVNGNVATNGTIVSSGNVSVNGTMTENANEEMLYIQKKLNYSYFSGNDVETYVDDYNFEALNININNPMEVNGTLEMTGNINLNSGIKALEDVNLNGEVKNTNNSVIFSETGDVNINTSNTNFSGLIYAPYGDIVIDTDNLNLNNVIIIGQTITIDCPSINANYNDSMAELIGTESDIDVDINANIYAMGYYNYETDSIDIEWFSNYENGTYEVWVSDDNVEYTSVAVVSDTTEYQYPITEDFETKYFKVSLTTNYGEYIESIPFIVTKSEEGYSVDFLDSDGDGIPDVSEITFGTNINEPDTDNDGLTDYQEVYITGTDPTVYDSVTSGILDADADSDEDGLSNIYEIETGTDPLLKDTDNDSISDYDEIYVYGTDPLNPDSDNDGLEDGDELPIGLNPTNPETFGVPDAEYQIEQTISSDSNILKTINTDENAYELSIDIKTNGYAEKEVRVSESGYSCAIENDAMIGLSADISISDTCNPEKIVLKYNIKDSYIDNTLNIYSSLDEFQGIKRLNIFKFDENKNMLLPVETEFDVENGLLYAEVDELGTYCIMDMEIWLNNLGIEMPNENAIESSTYSNTPVTMFSSNNDSVTDTGTSGGNLVWTPTFTNQPIDIVFILQSEGLDEKAFKDSKLVIQNYSEFLFSNYNDVRIMLITFGYGKTDTVYNNSASMYLTSISDVREALSKITYTITSGLCHTAPSFSKVFYGINYQQGSYRSVYRFINGNTLTDAGFDATITHRMGLNSYSEIYNPDWNYVDNDYNRRIKQTIEGRNDIFGALSDSTTNELINHIKSKVNNKCAVYEVFLPTNWKKITLKGQLSPTNSINSDEDSLTDWEEVDKDKLVLLDNNDYTLPYTTISHLIVRTENIYTDDPEWLFNIHEPIYYLPVISDPTMEDSDKDGILDHDEYTNITTDSRYDNINPLKADTLETLYPELTRNSKTNIDTNPIYLDIRKNTIYIDVKYKLNDKAYELSYIRKPDSTEYYTNEEIIMKSIEDKWNTEIQGNIFDFYPGMSIEVKIDLREVADEKYIGFIVGEDGKNSTSVESNDDWATNKINYIKLSTKKVIKKGDEKIIVDLPETNRFAAPAHELGHALGLSDLYGYSDEEHIDRRLQPVICDISKTTQNEIWYTKDGNNPDGDLMFSFGLVRANDVEMILLAYCDNQKQYFKPEFDKENEVSKAIKENNNNIYLDKYNKEFVNFDSKLR
ncbi:MAG: hypothetical protein NC244_13840, partial [Alistipes senegalensis]|nr:hypothetical protein [Alistipes senegalensis]